MPTREHQIWLELIRERPSLAADLLGCVQPDAVPVFAEARVESADLTEHNPTEYRADTVVSLLSGTKPAMAVIVEVQRHQDNDKLWSWPAYLATLRARRRCPVVLLVISPQRETARWCARPIPLGHPGLVFKPLVLGPDEIPTIIDPQQARTNPELAVLSAMIHGDGTDREKIFAAMLEGLENIESEQAQGYIDEVLAILPEAARDVLEEIMKTGTREYKSDFARHYYGRGLAEGEARGEAKMLLLVLDARGIELPDDARAKILECSDLAQIEKWGRRAGTVGSVDELFA
ncbi:hypothetical protein [Sphaerisporangium rhizosphaerae]|uniref:Uncharacterized protein n=1 Tax=Sphaerisporangium rhizosphaerae TaxID=2269375 RepID=A0ABW2PEE2_9ACTN